MASVADMIRHGGRIEAWHLAHAAHHVHQQRCASHADGAAHQRQESALQEKLQQDAAVGGAQRLAQADLACALAHRHQHDVDDADRAQRQRDQANSAEEDVHHVEDLAHGLGVLDRVPVLEGVLIVPVEAVIAGDDLAHFLAREVVLLAHPRAVVEERDRILLLGARQRKELVHDGVGQENAIIGGVVVAVTHALHHSNDVENEFRSAGWCCRPQCVRRETGSSPSRRRSRTQSASGCRRRHSASGQPKGADNGWC